MITKKDLGSLTGQTGFNLWQTERDYLQHLFLMSLSKHSKTELVFKGGTALQKVFGLNRFSIDLDFTSGKAAPLDDMLNKVNSEINNFGYPSRIRKTKESGSITFIFKIKGPLYAGIEKSESSLYIEVSLREPVLLDPPAKEIVPIYPDIQPYICLVMRLEEIMAEKVRTIMVRNKPRDVYDFWFLVKKGVKFDQRLANSKLKYYKKEFGLETFMRSVDSKKAQWKTDIGILMPKVPDFESVRSDIAAYFKSFM